MEPSFTQETQEDSTLNISGLYISDYSLSTKRSPSSISDASPDIISIREHYEMVQIEDKKYTKCRECHKLFSTKTSSTHLKKHYLLHQNNNGKNKVIEKAEDKELAILNFMIDCNIPFNTIRKDSFKTIMGYVGTSISEEKLINLIGSEAIELREKVFSKLSMNIPCSLQLDGWTNVKGEHLYAFFFKTSQNNSRYIQQEKAENYIIQGSKWLSEKLKKIIDKYESCAYNNICAVTRKLIKS